MLLVLISTFFLLFGTAKGLVSVRKGNETVACVTSNFKSAVAFVKKPGNDEDFTKVYYLDGEGKPVSLSKYDCNLVTENSCLYWKMSKNSGTKDWITSKNKTGDLITDFRWNDIPAFYFNAETSHRIRENSIGPFHLSILASKEVEIVVSSNSMSRRKVVIDGNQREEIVTAVFQLKNKNWEQFTGINQEIRATKIFHGGKRWTQVSIVVGAKNDPSLALSSDGRLIIRLEKMACGIENKCDIEIKSKGDALVKLHKYNKIYSYQRISSLTLSVDEDVRGICVDVVFYCDNYVLEAFTLEIRQGNNVVLTFTQNTANFSSDYNSWVTGRFEHKTLRLDGRWTLTLRTNTKNLNIGGIKFCAAGGSIVKPKGENMENCHLIAENPSRSTKLEDVANDGSICKALGGNCSEFSLCEENGECGCFAGGKCTRFPIMESQAEGKRLLNLVIATSCWNVASYALLAFQLLHYRNLRKLQLSVHSRTTPQANAQAETSFSNKCSQI